MAIHLLIIEAEDRFRKNLYLRLKAEGFRVDKANPSDDIPMLVVKEKIDVQRVLFESMERLPAGADAVFRITCQAIEPGDHRFRVQLTSDDMSTPVIKEESTRVYSD